MKKRIITLAAVATLALAMTACGSAQTSNDPTSTPEPTKAVEVTTAPTATTTPTVEPTKEPTAEPTTAPTEAPEVTAEPTEAPAEPTEAPSEKPSDIAEDPNFAKIKEMTENHVEDHEEYEYDELEALIETLDKSRYKVTEVASLEPVIDVEQASYDTAEYEKWLCEEGVFFDLAEITTEDGDTDFVDIVPTGEFYVMTLTDTVTGETIVWGLKVHAEAIDNPGEYYVLTHSNGIFYMLSLQMPIKDEYTTVDDWVDAFPED